ncbi:polysaccharide deacetylase family protein [Planctomicrobium sp. SH668]|uniref:polysaccharide deacetylase family protein n=1 Tax=Planctomicrobium sp. SH668 TaxID=3448126 RepID=UPI003F5C4564
MSKRELLARSLEWTGMGSLLTSTTGKWDGLVVFNYHRLGDPLQSQFDRNLYSAGQSEFEGQVRFLRQNYDVLRISDLEEKLPKRGRYVLITFDDGYRDNFELALPVLKQLGTPATFFITSGFIDNKPIAWWDEIAWMIRRCSHQVFHHPQVDQNPIAVQSIEEHEVAIQRCLRTFKSIPSSETEEFLETLASVTGSERCSREVTESIWMTWDMIRELDANKMDLGGHTVTHPVLAYSDPVEQEWEINQSKRRIETEIGHPITAFSYPVGQPDSFNEITKTLLEKAGYLWGFSFSGGFTRRGPHDPYDLPRVAVSPHISRELFQSTAKLPWIFA